MVSALTRALKASDMKGSAAVKKTIEVVFSDLSGDEAENGETVAFSYRGVDYTIDLTKQEAAGFDKAVGMYIEHATKLGGRRKTTVTGQTNSKEELANIRSWWREQGNEISDRGRIPAHIVEAYHAAH